LKCVIIKKKTLQIFLKILWSRGIKTARRIKQVRLCEVERKGKSVRAKWGCVWNRCVVEVFDSPSSVFAFSRSSWNAQEINDSLRFRLHTLTHTLIYWPHTHSCIWLAICNMLPQHAQHVAESICNKLTKIIDNY